MVDFDILFGALLIIAGSYLSLSNIIIGKKGFLTTGKVEKLVSDWSWRGSSITLYFYPVVSFKDEQNNECQLKLEFGSTPPLYIKGQRIRIIYYNGKIYPNGLTWKLFYCLIICAGLYLIIS